SRERPPIVRFDDEVQMIALHRELDEAKSESLFARREARAKAAHQALSAQVRDRATHLQGHVDGMGSIDARPRSMADAGALTSRLSSRAGALPAPGAEGEGELLLVTHFD